jgi:uncharacterized protein
MALEGPQWYGCSMRKILLLSDTHSHLDERILDFAKTVDEVWHAGDIGALAVTDALAAVRPLVAVYGNIDDATARRTFPHTVDFEVAGLRVVMTHIGGYPGRYAPGVSTQLDLLRPGLFICGHSHILKVMPDKKRGLLHMNPGAVGHHGFHHVRTMLRFEIADGVVKNLEAIELGKRGALT